MKDFEPINCYEDIQFLTLGIELYCAILGEMGCSDLHTDIVKKNLLEDLEKNPKSFMPNKRIKRPSAAKQARGLELPPGNQNCNLSK